MQFFDWFMWKWLYGPILISKADRLGTYAAALAYCFVLSLIPFLVVTFTLATEIAPEKMDLTEAYKDLLASILPSESGKETLRIITTVENTSHHGLATIGFILAVYTSFNLMMQVVRTLLFIFDDPRRPQEWTWRVIFKTVALFFIWMFLLLLISAVSILTPVFEKILHQLHVNGHFWSAPLLITRDMVVMVALFGAFFLTYFLVSSKKHSVKAIRNGSLVAACGWLFCSLLFAYVLPSIWRTNAVYEALGSVVITLIWAQACAWSVVVGACWIVRFSPQGKQAK